MTAASVIRHEVRSLRKMQTSPVVFVIDDDVSVRESLEHLIRHEGWKVETFESASEFLDRPRVLAPNCLDQDISMPCLNGLELQKRVAAKRPEMPIIFITGHGDVPKSVQAIKPGAVEFLTKPIGDESLLSAIRNAIERSKSLAIRNAELQAKKLRYVDLTSREREVFVLVVAGLLNKHVGSEHGINETAVKAHRGCVMRKMKSASLPELVNMATRLRLPRPKNSNIPAINQLISLYPTPFLLEPTSTEADRKALIDSLSLQSWLQSDDRRQRPDTRLASGAADSHGCDAARKSADLRILETPRDGAANHIDAYARDFLTITSTAALRHCATG